MDALYNQLIAGKQKAVVAFVVGLLVAYFAKHGLNLDTLTVGDALRMLGSAVIGYVSVYVKKNQ